jgi:diguanylate cyclase (GGDEF)-like protein
MSPNALNGQSAPHLDSRVLANLLHTMAQVEAPLQSLGLTASATMSRDSEAAFKSLLNQNGLIIVLSIFQLLFLSLAALSMSQKSRQLEEESKVSDVLGMHVKYLIADGPDEAELVDTLISSVNEHGYWLGERVCRRKDGSQYPAMLSIRAVRSGDGVITSYALFFNDITDLKKKQQELEYVATYDVLTALPNRSLFRDRLRTAVDVSARLGHSVAVGFIDLDGFKEVNDKFGHAVGDQLLVALANQMRAALRVGDSIARLGGDEFIVLINGLEEVDACIPVLERLLGAASSAVFVDDNRLQVYASIGVTVFPEDNVNIDHLVRHADQAMYRAKQSGKNQYAFFDSAREKALDATQATLPEIKLELQRSEFVLHYQPKVNMQTGETVGVEALIRWNHPVRGLLPPAEFLPHIEGKLVSVELSGWVIAEAFRQMQAWHQTGLRMPVSVNVGALHLQPPRFYEDLHQCTENYPQCRAMLSIEILETSALSDLERIRTMMQKCQSIGVEFALDDFGTGNSSLSYLSDLPTNEVKIDQRFVKTLVGEQNHLSIVEGIVGLTQAFRRVVVAEGVETAEVGELQLRLGCKFGQGYFIARPMPAEKLANWLASWQPPPAWRAHAEA